jgi:WD40 repeat protein
MAVKDYYFAFISYSHKDEVHAKWLHQQFEKYHLPAHIAEEQKGLPCELSPIFRDEDELSGGDLKNEIQQALINSNWLVIVCSPAAAKSDYVDLEIREFIDSYKQRNATKGKNETREERIARIIPIIASGKPYSPDEEEECFPPILHELRREDKERRAPNVNASDEGWERSFICAVATMLDLPFDTLWDRRTREMEKQRQALIETNNRIRRNQARFVSEKAHQLTESNDPYLAALLAVNVLPNEEDEQSFPYVVEAERALREACAHDEQQLRHRSMVWFAALSPDETRIASACQDGSVWLWERSTGKCLWTRKEHTECVQQVAFCPCGNRIASASLDGTVRIWDAETGNCLRVIEGQGGKVFSVAFSPDGLLLAFGSEDAFIRLMNLTTNTITTLAGHERNVLSLCFSSDGETLISSSADTTVRIWKHSTGLLGRNRWKCVRVLEGHIEGVWSARFSPDEQLIASASLDNTVRIWDTGTGECRKVLNEKDIIKQNVHPSENLGKGAQYASFSPDGKLVVAAFHDEKIRIMDWRTSLCVNIIATKKNWASSVLYTRDGKEIIGGYVEAQVRIHKNCKKHFYHPTSSYSSPRAVFGPKDLSVISDCGRLLRIWDAVSGECTQILQDTTFLKHSDGNLHFVKGVSKQDFRFVGHVCAENSPIFFPERKCLVLLCKIPLPEENGDMESILPEEWDVHLYDINTWELIQTFKGHTDYVATGLFTPDGFLAITTSSDKTVRVWDIQSGKCLRVIEDHHYPVFGLSISASRKLMATMDFHTIMIWNLPDFSCCRTIVDDDMSFMSVDLSPDGQRVAAVCSNTVRLWEKNTEEYVMSLSFPDKEPESVSFSSDGRKLLASFKGGYIKILDVPPLQELIDDTFERFRNRPLTMEEKHRFYLD